MFPSEFSRLQTVIFLLAGAVLASFFGAAQAVCSQPDPRVCAEFFHSDAVFVGTVISVRTISSAPDFVDAWTYRLAVKKIYRGPARKVIEVRTENDSGRFPLESGYSYLLFASKFEGHLTIFGCGNSAELSKATDAIRGVEQALKAINSSSVGDIRGHVRLSTVGQEKEIKGLPIIVRGAQKTYRTALNEDGWFHIEVPPGKYSIKTGYKKWYLRDWDLSYDNPNKFVVNRGGCVELELVATPK